MIRVIKIWFKAIFLNGRYWIVTYKDGTTTRRLEYREAKDLRDVFKGKLSINYK